METVHYTEGAAAALALFGILFGMGKTFWEGRLAGKCLLPPTMIKFVNVPMAVAMIFRIATLLQAEPVLWILIGLDVLAFIVLSATVLQHFGLFVRRT